MLAFFRISMRSDKPAGMMKMVRELQLIRPPSHRRWCVFEQVSVLPDLRNHTELKCTTSMSYRVFLLLSRLNFVICKEEISSLRDAYSC